MIGKLKIFIIIVLAVFLMILFFQNKKINQQNAALTLINKTLKDNEQLRVEVERGQIIILNRKTTGQTGKNTDVIEKKGIYTPPEGKAVISQDLTGKVTIQNTNKGFCIEPGLAGQVDTSGELSLGFSLRVAYWDRYGIGGGINTKLRPYAFIDRRIDDFIKFANNTTVGMFYDGGAGVFIAVFF